MNKKRMIGASLAGALCLLATANATTLGLNANGLGNLYNETDIDALGKTWIRIFIPIFDKNYTGLRNDNGIKNFKNLAAKSKYKATLSIKWDFKGKNLRIPEIGSNTMGDYEDMFTDLLDYMGKDIDKLVVGNEPMWETKSEDRVWINQTKGNPQSKFYIRLANVAKKWKSDNNASFDIYIGSFNRLDVKTNRESADVKALIKFAKDNSWVKGIDIHAHTKDYTQFENCFKQGRSLLGSSKDIISTEWSLVDKWKSYLNEKLPSSFVNTYGYSTNDTLLSYLNKKRTSQAPKAEWDAYFNSRTWWDKDMPKKAKDKMNAHGVGVTHYAFKNGKVNSNITSSQTPWYLNGLYQDAFVSGTRKHAYIWDNFKNN